MKSSGRGLQFKVNGSIAILVMMVFGTIIYLNISDQQDHLKTQLKYSANMLAESLYQGILHPMSVGDSETIREQMTDMGKDLAGVDVFIFGLDKLVAYASDKEKTGTDLTGMIKSADLNAALDRVVHDGRSTETAYEEQIEGETYLTVLCPIHNEKRCYHCHGSSRSVLGGMMARQSTREMYASMSSLRNKNIIIGAAGCLFIVLFLFFLISKLAIRPITRLIDGLRESADHVASASEQVSGASQSLAEGASEQAASIEETSSSLEEISSMTQQNAQSAGQADNLMKGANHVVNMANESMEELTKSMEEISRASEETSKIIKTIDEIAFQTNLLALNAAVEAARAGEAGAGFAVVADEVRNLAMRAADAAKNTATLIEGTVKRVKDGAELVTRTNEAFSEVAGSAAKVGELVAEIAAASNEQAQGIEQVNKAVADMDKVTQQNAANAEESASASEEMNGQAEQMQAFVGELVGMVGGSSSIQNTGTSPGGNARRVKPAIRTTMTKRDKGKLKALAAPAGKAKARPEDIIPMDDDDFKGF